VRGLKHITIKITKGAFTNNLPKLALYENWDFCTMPRWIKHN